MMVIAIVTIPVVAVTVDQFRAYPFGKEFRLENAIVNKSHDQFECCGNADGSEDDDTGVLQMNEQDQQDGYNGQNDEVGDQDGGEDLPEAADRT